MTSTKPHSEPFEPDSFDAKEALAKGDADVLARYLDELGPNLRTIGDLLAPKGDALPQLVFAGESSASAFERAPVRDEEVEEEDWTGTTSQLRAVIAQRSAQAIGIFLRETAELIERLQRVVDTDKSSIEEWHLALRRRKAGRPRDRVAAMNEESGLAMMVRFQQRTSRKKELAVQDVVEGSKRKQGRSTVYRKLARHQKRNTDNM